MKKTCLALLIIALSLGVSAQNRKIVTDKKIPAATPPITLPLTAEAWEFQAGKVSFIRHKGVNAIKMDQQSGVMLFRDLHFIDGTIEFDVEVDIAQPFAAIYFRWQNDKESEHIYLRTGRAGKDNAYDAVQYASIIKGVNLWDLQHEYQSAAHLNVGEWNHVKVIVSGSQLKAYVNSSTAANLEVPCLEGNTTEGKIGIGAGFQGNVIFANLKVHPGNTEGLSPAAGADITKHDTRYIRNWEISAPDSLEFGREAGTFMIPKLAAAWEKIEAERRGLVNISRKYGGASFRRVVWLRTTIKSEFDQVMPINMGFSDEMWVFVNQRLQYADKNIYYQNMQKSPDGRISIENCSFRLPLVKGNNELLIALSNDFYGWGIMARLEHLYGIELLK
jgi:hypothetical protein